MTRSTAKKAAAAKGAPAPAAEAPEAPAAQTPGAPAAGDQSTSDAPDPAPDRPADPNGDPTPLPRDGDGDGLIYDGTADEQPKVELPEGWEVRRDGEDGPFVAEKSADGSGGPDVVSAETLAELADAVAALIAAAAAKANEAPAPSSAVIDPPPAPAAEENPQAILPTMNEAAAERLRVTRNRIQVTDQAGNQVDPDAVFTDPGPDGQVRCLVRLIQHTTATVHDRPVSTLLLPAGGYISVEGARQIIATIKAANAGD